LDVLNGQYIKEWWGCLDAREWTVHQRVVGYLDALNGQYIKEWWGCLDAREWTVHQRVEGVFGCP